MRIPHGWLALALATACTPNKTHLGDGWYVQSDPELPHELRFSVKVRNEAGAEVRCTLDGDPSEVHVVRKSTDDAHDITVRGLLADERYHCVLEAGEARVEADLETPPAVVHTPHMWVENDDPSGAYTLFNVGDIEVEGRAPRLFIVDVDGRVRWSRAIDQKVPDLDASYLGNGSILYGGGHAVAPTRVNLSNEVLWEGPVIREGGAWHHDVRWLEDDTVLGLTHTTNTRDDVTFGGFVIDQVNPTDNASVWSWDSQSAVDDGILQPGTEDSDSYHVNGLAHWGSDILVNSYLKERLLCIDPASGEVLWQFGRHGDWVLLDATGTEPAPRDDWFFRAHAPEVHGNRLLLYDNGVYRNPRMTRAVEYELDPTTHTAKLLWEWSEGWYEPIWGDIDLLPRDHVLVTKAHCAPCGGASEGTTELIEIDRATNEVVWRLGFDDSRYTGYRAERIDGCDVFANARYCPELLD